MVVSANDEIDTPCIIRRCLHRRKFTVAEIRSRRTVVATDRIFFPPIAVWHAEQSCPLSASIAGSDHHHDLFSHTHSLLIFPLSTDGNGGEREIPSICSEKSGERIEIVECTSIMTKVRARGSGNFFRQWPSSRLRLSRRGRRGYIPARWIILPRYDTKDALHKYFIIARTYTFILK